jgi:hypothetical protein
MMTTTPRMNVVDDDDDVQGMIMDEGGHREGGVGRG